MMDLAIAAERSEVISLLLKELASSQPRIEDCLESVLVFFSGNWLSRYRIDGFLTGESDPLS
jgi:hypothetical protein